MTTRIPRLLLWGVLLAPSTLFALGLGEIRLNSALNQPFDAEIELISPTTEELQSLKIGLASGETFSQYGVDRAAFLSSFRFRIVRSADGRNVIKVTSRDRVTEPFVTFILQAGWSRGRLLREYTVLLDPPVYMPPGTEEAAAVATPRSGAQSEGVIERPRSTQTRPASAAPSPSRAPAIAGGTYTVQRNDTLWRIASRIRPGSARVVNQTMIALYRANPEAFDGNINLLRSGAVLQIPEGDAIDQIAASEATREVAAQYEAWQGRPADSARLRLVAPEESALPSASSTAATPSQPSAADSALRSRVQSLESELAEAKRLLEVRNAELARLQQQLSQQGSEAAIEPEPVAATPLEPEPAAEAPAEPEVEPAPVAEPPAQPTRPAAQPRVVSEPEPSLLQRIGDYWWALVVLGLLLLAGLLLYFRRRREPDIDEAIETLTPREFPSRATKTVARGRAEPSGMEALDEATSELSPPPAFAQRNLGGAAAGKSADDTISSETGISFDQQDALAEADFHMAYGLYDQAADLVKIAIEREPDRRELKLKLLEIYFVWGNKDLFLETARDLETTRDQAEPGEWDKVLIMGKQICPDDPMFEGALAAGGSDIVDLNLEGGENRVDVDLFGGTESSDAGRDLDFDMGGAESSAAARSADDSGIDFLLDEPQRGSGEFDYDADTSARTQETPTVESEVLDSEAGDARLDDEEPPRHTATTQLTPTVTSEALEEDEEFADANSNSGGEETAELAIDDLDLDVDPFADTDDHDSEPVEEEDEAYDLREATGSTALLDDDDMLSSASTAEHPQIAEAGEVDFDLSDFDDEQGDDRTAGTNEWSTDGLQRTVDAGDDSIELDDADEIGGTRSMEVPSLSELEPVTMSEVGTKLDLARAYVDMGDPDGARSILEEVLQEGSAAQQQEAQRLLDSLA
jgi:pilus assembly protein FimV